MPILLGKRALRSKDVCTPTRKSLIYTLHRQVLKFGDATQWLGSNTVPREDLNSLNIYSLLPLLFSLYTYLSCSTNTEGVLLCSTRFIGLSGTGFLYLAMNRQGMIVYNLPYTHICRRVIHLALNAAGQLPRNFPESFRRCPRASCRAVPFRSQSCAPCQFQMDKRKWLT